MRKKRKGIESMAAMTDLINEHLGYKIKEAMIYRNYLVLVFLLLNGISFGQELETETVEVVKNFEARLADANKIRLEPAPEVKEVTDKRFDYLIEEKSLQVDYLAPSIKALGVSTEKIDPGYRGFVKAGFGYPLSPYLDAGYLFGEEGNSNLLARLSHHSANDKNIENQRFSDNDLLLKGTLLTDKGFSLDGFGTVSLDNHYFYGYNQEDTTFEADDVRNKLNLYELGLKIYNSAETDTKLNYWAAFKGYRFGNNFATRETGLNIDLGLTKWFGDNPLSIALGTDLTRLKDTAIQKLNTFYINPSFSFGTSSLRFKIGAELASADEEYFIFPDAELLLNVAGSGMSIFVGTDGGLRKNNFRILSDYNPFLVPQVSSIKNSSFYDFYAGVKGLAAGIEYSAQAGYKPTNDLALFEVNQEKEWTRFDVLYDTANIIYLQASVKGQLFQNLDLSGSIVQNFYDLNNEDKAWYLPNLQANIGLSYLTLDQQLRLKAEVYVNDAVAYQELGLPNEPNLLFDVSLGADYFLTPNFGLFLHLNNLSTNKYRRWYGYPGFGLNVLGGLTARF
ncbi:MAG: hypothetical protein HKN76_00875 [Saprospiraceae bacterium]|nr:hypothetical protein [Saprospiraceae bacterium]